MHGLRGLRRDLPGQRDFDESGGEQSMSETVQEHHISSAVVSVVPEHADDVVRKLEAMADTEVHHRTDSKIIIVLEGASENAIGGRLAEIALLDHVLSANLVYEIIDTGAADTAATVKGEQP